MCVCVCACMHACIVHVCVYVCVHAWVHWLSTEWTDYMWTCQWVVDTSSLFCTHTHTHMHTHTHACTHMHAPTHSYAIWGLQTDLAKSEYFQWLTRPESVVQSGFLILILMHTIGRFIETGLHEWLPFVIFHARNHERSQRHFRANFCVGFAQ